jgi:hypothetical protein
MPGKNITVWSPTTGDLVLNAALLGEILGAEPTALVDTAITTVGAGVLTAAGLIGGQITRTGPTANYTDTTDTAAAIVAALGSAFVLGQTFTVLIKNATPYFQTIAAGTGVTLPAAVVIPPICASTYFGTVGGTAAAPTVTFAHQVTVPIRTAASIADPQSSALITVGAGTILAASIAAGITARGGTQTAVFTDTTDSAANIIAGVPALNIVGAAIEWTYVNNTIFPATIHAGATVTLTDTVVPANSWAKFLVSFSAAGAVTMIVIGQGFFPHSGTVTANAATPVAVTDANVTANSQILLTYKSGTQGATGAFVSSSTPQTGFSIKSVTSDTAVYNYTILG